MGVHSGFLFLVGLEQTRGWAGSRQSLKSCQRSGGFKNPEEVSTLVLLKGIRDVYFGGDTEAAPALAGRSAGLIDDVRPARQIIEETVAQFFAIAGRLGGLASRRSFG